MTDTIRDLLISLASHMAYMQGQLEARHELDDPEDFYWYRESVLLRQKVTDALADGPAVPDGREPASVTRQPSDEDLLETLDKATAAFPPRHPEAEGLNAVEYPLALELRKARAVLARWGNPAPQPHAEGEVAGQPSDEELLKLAEDWPATTGPRHDLSGCPEVPLYSVFADEVVEFARAVLTRWGTSNLAETRSSLGGMPTPVPADKGEVEELVVELRMMASQAAEACQFTDAENLSRAADLLQRLSPPQPVPVSERLPAMVTDGLRVAGDCDEQGRCWAGTRASVDTSGDRDIDLPPSWELREVCAQDDAWLPAYALPIPHQQENAND